MMMMIDLADEMLLTLVASCMRRTLVRPVPQFTITIFSKI